MGQSEAFDWVRVRRRYLEGDYGECRELLKRAPGALGQIWLARVDSRAGKDAESLQRLLAIQTADDRLAAERDIWLALAYASTGEFSLADQLLDRALRVLRPPDEAYYRGQHIRGLAHFLAGDFDAASSAISVLLQSANSNDRAQAYSLRSWIAAKRDVDLRAQLRDLVASLDMYEQAAKPDQFTFVRTLNALAALCREIPTEGVVNRILRNLDRVRVNEATAFPHFQTTRVLGWVDALQGDEVSAMRRWRNAEATAPTDFWRVFCVVDRAFLADAMGRKEASRELLKGADTQASRLSWSSTRDEERLILLTIAQLLAPNDPARAQRYLATFRSLNTQPDPRMAFVNDRRARALQLYPQGTALLHLDDREAGIEMLQEAWEIFTAYEYGWRAALAALELFEVTKQNEWLERAREQIRPWPHSWIARDVRNAE